MNNIYVDIYNKDAFLRIGNRKVKAYIGLKGAEINKQEGDNKTPIGIFNLGIAFGFHDKVDTRLPYIKISKYQYWVDDIKSDYYNKLVDINNVIKDWNSAEHLIDYPKEYEYAIEIKTNPNNIKGKGSAIFIHCFGNNKYTAGCIAISKEDMIFLLREVDTNTKIYIDSKYD